MRDGDVWSHRRKHLDTLESDNQAVDKFAEKDEYSQVANRSLEV